MGQVTCSQAAVISLVQGQRLVFSPFVVHRDPRYYEGPEEFRPERWLDEATVKSLSRYAYFPFGGGTRSRVGCTFAMREIVLVTATIAQRFRLRLAGGG